MTKDIYCPIPGLGNGNKTNKMIGEIPFEVNTDNEGNVLKGSYEYNCNKETYEAICLSGMVTSRPEGSEWWGYYEYNHIHILRTFIGDFLGNIQITYSDGFNDKIPLIFGVNVWIYDLINDTQVAKNYTGPYTEPFESDQYARKLLEDSLVLKENKSEENQKGMAYCYCIKTRKSPMEKISFLLDPFKAGVYISGVTGVKDIDLLKNDFDKVIPDKRYFTRKDYFNSMDRLSRRLYQYMDEIPENDPVNIPEKYEGPLFRFEGTGPATVFSNVMVHNYHDMICNKITEDGRSRTSSKGAPSFGSYVGHGLYKKDVGSYYEHMWSRDVGRVDAELAFTGSSSKLIKTADIFHQYLEGGPVFEHPNWKRIANVKDLGSEDLVFSMSGKENDGHSSVMMFIYKLFEKEIADLEWFKSNSDKIKDAAEWICWQIDEPEKSGFDLVLNSKSEASDQLNGGYDLFSNTHSYYALKGYSKIAKAIGEDSLSKRWEKYAGILREGIEKVFIINHPRHGKIFVDTTDDCWTYAYKRFAPLFVMADYHGLKPYEWDQDWYEISKNTYKAQKEEFFSYGSGRQMGYGQGYITQAAILLDESFDMKGYIEYASAFSYHHTDFPYIVPEGVIMHPGKNFWFRNGDLGNSVQQGEIFKCGRLVTGIDDHNPEEALELVPRIPEGWNLIETKNYPVKIACGKNKKSAEIFFKYIRTEKGFETKAEISEKTDKVRLRVGPFNSEKKDFVVEGDYSELKESFVKDNSKFIELTFKDTKDIDVKIY